MSGKIKVDVEKLENELSTLQSAVNEFEKFFNDFKNTVDANLEGQDSWFVNEYRYIVDSMQDNIDRKQLDQVKKIETVASKAVDTLKQMDKNIAEQTKKGGGQ